MPSFADAHLKIERADKHIEDIKTRIGLLEESCFADIEFHPKFGKHIKYDLSDRTAGKEIGILIGDVLHNLKCALDYAWLTTLERHAFWAITDKTQFPVHPSLDSLERALKQRKIDLTCRGELFKLVLTIIKPYAGEKDALWHVKQLNILDKHRLLLPLVTYTTIDGLETENDSGESIKGSSGGTTYDPPWYIPIRNGWHVKDKGKPSIAVVFDEGALTHGLDVVSMLEFYSITQS